jgi:hypothetical protein
MNQSLGAVEANFELGSGGSLPPQQTSNNGGPGSGAAGSNDLNKRLAEMKAKLAALKNQRQ